MAQTLVSLLVHVVFSTKERRPLITSEVEDELYRYVAGTLQNFASPCLAVGGTENHVHLLISQSKNIALSRLMEELKKSSSKWIKTKGTKLRRFGWQDGYGAFSIGESQVGIVKRYIARQKERHRKQTFEQELMALLQKYQIGYDERYLWR
ncbi:MAG TPA: IS200/IS605 family transposase [Terriglobia bacterium]|nr:IS200/IS605 family transposase [Terriglobia bacterium]HEX5481072.1 IS200/IS605 family transposase [Terriglobia bacterium]